MRAKQMRKKNLKNSNGAIFFLFGLLHCMCQKVICSVHIPCSLICVANSAFVSVCSISQCLPQWCHCSTTALVLEALHATAQFAKG